MSNRTGKMSGWVCRVMAGACVLAGLGMGGCDAAVETAREAQRDANQALRRAASAGQPRVSEALLEKVQETPLLEREGLQSQVGDVKTMVPQQPAEKDLAEASDQISRALRAELSQDVKAALQAQAAAISLQLASKRFHAIHGRLEEIARRSAALQSSAQAAIETGAEATALSASVKAPTSQEVDQAKANLQTRQAALQTAQGNVTRLEQEIASRQQQARTIYSRTQTAFQQADAQKGQAAIDAAKKAIEESKEGDRLMLEAGNLEPQLAQAKSALALAEVGVKDAERVLAAATAAFEAGNTLVKQYNERITALKDAAKKVISEDRGVAQQYAELVKLVNEIEPDLKTAYEAAEEARSQYQVAASSWYSAQNALSSWTQERELPADDPLVKSSRDKRSSAMLNWAQAAAADQAGRIQAAGYQAANLLSAVKGLVDRAHQAAGMPAPQATLPDKTAYQEAADKSFAAAVEAARAGNDMASPEQERIKWIGQTLAALANQGRALVKPSTQATADAKAAATEAVNVSENGHGNPDMAPLLRRAGIDVAG